MPSRRRRDQRSTLAAIMESDPKSSVPPTVPPGAKITPGGRVIPPDSAADSASPGDAFRKLLDDGRELLEYVQLYLSAKADAVKAQVRTIGLLAVLGVLGAVAGAGIIVTAAVLIVVGVADALGALFGGHYWAGDLVTGVLFLGIIGGGACFMMGRLTNSSKRRTVQKYEERLNRQRQDFGTDVHQQAAKQASQTTAIQPLPGSKP